MAEQYSRKYNINCETLIKEGKCRWKRKEDCPKYKKFNGIENIETKPADIFTTQKLPINITKGVIGKNILTAAFAAIIIKNNQDAIKINSDFTLISSLK